ncbi:Uncharacterised protein, partial [Metamycoplasma alkalescens]
MFIRFIKNPVNKAIITGIIAYSSIHSPIPLMIDSIVLPSNPIIAPFHGPSAKPKIITTAYVKLILKIPRNAYFW